MAAIARKYNPGFLTDDELVASFCVRTREFKSIVEMLRECTGSSNPHQIVIGPRGSGKTSLLLRVAAEVRGDVALSAHFFPIVFAEESYEVATTGEFWLECLSRLAAQAPRRDGGPDLERTVEDLRTNRDDRTLAGRCLASLLDFADREGKRLVLMVENLNMMFRDMADPEAEWRLRHTLQTEARIVMLASATSRFDEIDNPEHALYQQFRVLPLRPLDTNECAVLWETVSGRCPVPETIRSLEILTGGSPRLLTILARFGAGLSFRELMADLLNLVDDHTEYFKSHIESLPPQERRVYLALAELWKPATTREIADRSRLETSKCSAQLARLMERGVVEVEGGTARRKQYYLTERLYNIYYLLRRSRGSHSLIEAIINFMASYYSPQEQWDIVAAMIRDAQHLEGEMRSFRYTALAQLMEQPALAAYREDLLATIPKDFVESLGRSSTLSETAKTVAANRTSDDSRAKQLDGNSGERPERAVGIALFDKAVALNAQNRAGEALAVFDELVCRFGESEASALLKLVARALVGKGITLKGMNRVDEALDCYDETVRRFGGRDTPDFLEPVSHALVEKALTLRGLNRADEALTFFDDVVYRFGKSNALNLLEPVAVALVAKGATLVALTRLDEALAAYDEVVHRFGDSGTPALHESVAVALVNKGSTLLGLNRLEESLVACDEVVRRFGESDVPVLAEQVAQALVNKGVTLNESNRADEAYVAWDQVVHRFGNSNVPSIRGFVVHALVNKGISLGALNRLREALTVYEDAVDRFEVGGPLAVTRLIAVALVNKGAVLDALERPDEALTAYDEVVRRFGDSEKLPLLHSVANALVGKGTILVRLHQNEESLRAYDDALSRYASNDTPEIRRLVAMVLVNKGVILGELDRPEEALAVFGEALRRFKESDKSFPVDQFATVFFNMGITLVGLNRSEEALVAYEDALRLLGETDFPFVAELVAKGLVNKGVVLGELNRREEALDACDEVVSRFGESDALAVLEQVSVALVNKGSTLIELNRTEAALVVYDEIVDRFEESGFPTLRAMAEWAYLQKADIELRRHRYEQAIETASHALDGRGPKLPANRLKGHVIRVRAALATGNGPGCERDIEGILAVLPEVESFPKAVVDTLIEVSVELGAARVRDLIQDSRSANLLLPLTTALEWELGREPRVARETKEVAGDIRRELARLKRTRTGGVEQVEDGDVGRNTSVSGGGRTHS